MIGNRSIDSGFSSMRILPGIAHLIADLPLLARSKSIKLRINLRKFGSVSTTIMREVNGCII